MDIELLWVFLASSRLISDTPSYRYSVAGARFVLSDAWVSTHVWYVL